MNRLAGQVEALPGQEPAVRAGARGHAGALYFLHLERDASIVEQQPVARFELVRQVGMRDRDSTIFAASIGVVQGLEGVYFAPVDIEWPRENSHSDLRALEVRHDRERSADFSRYFSSHPNRASRFLVRTVREVDPDGIHAGVHETAERLGIPRSRSYRADDLGATNHSGVLLNRLLKNHVTVRGLTIRPGEPVR